MTPRHRTDPVDEEEDPVAVHRAVVPNEGSVHMPMTDEGGHGPEPGHELDAFADLDADSEGGES